MGILERGKHHSFFELNHFGIRTDPGADFGLGAHVDDFSISNGDGPSPGSSRIHGVDGPPTQHKIGFGGTLLASRNQGQQ
jgi:hypothetical protein